jgi:O-antigen ligase
MVLSVPGSLYPGLSFNFIVQNHIKTFILMALLAASVRTLKDVERFAAVQVFGMGLYSAFILLRFDIGEGGRLGNLVYYDANDLGMLIICTLPLAIYFLRQGMEWRWRIIAAVVLPLALMTIVKTGSRGTFIGLIAVVLYMLFQFRAVSKRARITAAIAALVALLFLGNETYWETMRTILNPQEDYNWSGQSSSGRMEVWKRGVGYMLERPLFGVGVNAFGVAEGTISDLAVLQEYGIGLKWSAAHNSFVEAGAELGFPGLISFVCLLAAAYYACSRIGRHSAAGVRGATNEAVLGQVLCATLVGYVAAGFFLSQAYSAYMYATYGIIVGLVKVATPG